MSSSSPVRLLLVCGVAALVTTSTRAQGTRAAGPPALVQQVRAALAHGALDEARRLATTSSAAAAAKQLAPALVEVFEGRDDQARTRLKTLADADRLGEAALELGLLEMRHGRRDEGRRLLDALASVRTLNTPDDYFRLARAARGNREYLLANDAYNRIPKTGRADVHTERADMFLQRHRPGDAVIDYRAALEADPAWVPAHVGLARAFREEDPEAAEEEMDAARKLAPDHPDLLLATAEHAFGEEDFAAAKQALDRLAKVRPGTVDEAALRAAIAYAERRPADIDAAVAKVAEIDPRSAKGWRLAGQSAASKYRFEDAAGYARKAVALDPADADAQMELGLYLLRTGDEKTARTALDDSWALDKSNVTTKNLLDMLDSLEKFEVVQQGDIIFKFSKEEAAVLKPYALPLADEAYKTFSEHYGFKPSGPILVEVFPRHDDFAVRTIGLPGIVGALGACFGRVVSMDSPRARPPGEFSWHATLWHELAHVFTLQMSEYRVPRWLTEGLSVFEEHRREPAWGRELTLEYARALGKGKNFGVKALPDAFKHPESLSLAYFEASLVVEHLVALNGDAGLRTLLQAYANGSSDTDAFAKAFGRSIDQVEASFRGFVDQRYGALRDALKDPPSQVNPADLAGLKARASGAPGNFVSQLALGQALAQAGDLEGARAALERAAKLAPQASGSASPHALLAQIALKQNDRPRARKELRDLLTYDHENVAAARQLAQLATEDKASDDQDFALRRVADVDPFDGDTHGYLGRRELARGRQAAALIEFQAALAVGPPNLAEAHADIAEVLLGMGRRDDAKREALLALKEAPTFARAQDLLLAAIGK